MFLVLAACAAPSPAPDPDAGGPPGGGGATDTAGTPSPSDTSVDTAEDTGTTVTTPPLLTIADVDVGVGRCVVLGEFSGGAGDHLGAAVVAVGDLDGYGVSTLAVLGARGLTLRDPDGAVRATLDDVTALSSAGDVDGDGIVDLFVRRKGTGGGPATGGGLDASEVRSGRTLDVLATGDGELNGMAALGDVTSDGRTEVGWLDLDNLRVVDGASGELLAQIPYGGGALAGMGDGSAVIGTEDAVARVRLDGTVAWTVATGGPPRIAPTDAGDVLVGDPALEQASALAGADGGGLWTDTLAGVGYGGAVAAAGADALVGGDGAVRVLTAGGVAVELREKAAAPPSGFGRAVASVADQDGDGRPELAVGAPDAGLGQGGVALLSCTSGPS